ncbi:MULTISPECIES: terminase small subunit [unclassified Mesorhizobium]|uniref:terminase small subunit n=1 Tax=unclassified Mesorhizobium TaxID=325217 RepID=UPI003339C155
MSASGTELQIRFAIAYARNGGNAKAAAIEAGYSEKSADDLGRRALESPTVHEMILQEVTRQRARAGVVGLHALITVAESDRSPAPAKVAAGRALLEFAGLAGSSRDLDDEQRRDGGPAPDYKAILDGFAQAAAAAMAAPKSLQ